ncbi:putative GCR1-dependent translation factor 1 [Amylocarpus encephaloides]|uniref:GCR1-dependent translation factor 1 n=1 Tax=Amylocarpus encephaloides TaxID=45428 RepID=A0A9P8C0X9_9HELO|nr:putative GCR1-dependent translation factor 1 [Amylocarpus encephaloides]
MRFRKRPSPLLLLLLPSLAAAISPAAQENIGGTGTKNTPAVDAKVDPKATSVVDLNSKPKFEIGTKDAPVDGKDGKPHAGPWVGTEKDPKKDQKKDAKKSSETKEEAELVLAPGKTDTKKLKNPDGTKIPEVNDGVMDDPHRQPPKEGTTGTEGGVSEKDKARKAKEGQTGERLEKKPDSPKEAPPLPLSETKKKASKEEKTKPKDADTPEDDDAEIGGLEKPNDLPSKPNNLPHPIPGSADKDHLDINKPPTKPVSEFPSTNGEGNEGIIQPLHSYLLSLTMILFSEIGDKTFLIAALMAMKHDRILVFSAAFSALFVMTVLSAVLGHAVPTLIPERFTHFLAAALFLVFGAKMLREGLALSPDEGVAAEMQEVEMELEEKEHLARKQNRRRSSISPYALEMGLGGRSSTRKSRSGSRLPSPPRSPSSSPDRSPSPPRSNFKGLTNGLSNLFSLLLSPAWVQTFVMTFLGEWGDRSQIATIAMAAGADYWWVTGGAVCGHAVCTGVAVIGGRAIAGRVSLRVGMLSLIPNALFDIPTY